MNSVDQLYKPPQAEIGPPRAPEVDAQFVPTGFGIRAAARIVDTALGFGVGAFAGVVAEFVAQSMGVRTHAGGALHIVLALPGPLAYHVAAESIGGATLGKLVCGLRVVKDDGRRCTFFAALVRSVFYYVDAFFFGIVGYVSMSNSPLQQRVGDKVAHTVVARAATVRTPNAVIGMLAGLLMWAAYSCAISIFTMT